MELNTSIEQALDLLGEEGRAILNADESVNVAEVAAFFEEQLGSDIDDFNTEQV